MSRFLNLFLLIRPNTLPSGYPTLLNTKSSVTYILHLLGPLLGLKALSNQSTASKIEVKKEAEDDLNRFVKRKFKVLMYTSNFNTWYID